MLKRIPKSDISIRPFKAYKEWSFISGSSDISLLEAVDGNYTSTTTNVITTGSLSGSSYNKHSIFGQLRAQFYNGYEDNPFIRTGHKKKSYSNLVLFKERFLSGSAKVISIPQIYVGEGIKKGSVVLNDNNFDYTDDSFGNLQNYRDQIIISSIDVQNGTINFIDSEETVYSASLDTYVGAFDISSGTLDLIVNGVSQSTIEIISFDFNNGELFAENISFLPVDAHGNKIGNVFYNQGLVVVTRNSDSKLSAAWELSYKSTKTIYEHEYLLIVNGDEFNVSQNPTAVLEIGRENGFISGSDGKIYKTTITPGVKYIKKLTTLETGNILDFRYSGSIGNTKAGFEHYDISSSVDSTGSFLSPMITTIGLYDDNCDLVAIAKLPQPIKSMPDLTVNFIVRFDT